MNPSRTRRPRARDVRRAGVALPTVLVLAALAAAASGCGGSSSGGQSAGVPTARPTSIQVMATATRGDLTQSASGLAKMTTVGGKKTVVVTVPAQAASTVAAGQSATVFFPAAMRNGFPQGGQGGFPRPGAGGSPQPGASGFPRPGASGFPQGSQGGFPRGGQGGFFQGAPGARGAVSATVARVTSNSDGTATAVLKVASLPAKVTAKSVGFAQIVTKVLARNVVLIPTEAVKGSGSSATVQVLANGQTQTRTITVGRQSGAETEVVSGLNAGESVIYTRTFRGFFGGGGFRSGAPFSQGQYGGQSGGSSQ